MAIGNALGNDIREGSVEIHDPCLRGSRAAGMSFETKTTASGLPASSLSINLPSRLGASATLSFLSMSLVPAWRRTTFGRYDNVFPNAEDISSILKPLCP